MAQLEAGLARAGRSPPAAPAAAEQHVHTPSAAVQQELAVILSRDAAEFPCIRKTNHTPPKYSVYDVIMLVKGSSRASASKEFYRLRERHGDGLANWQPIRFRDLTSRLNKFLFRFY